MINYLNVTEIVLTDNNILIGLIMKKDKGYKKLLSQLITYVKPHKSSFAWSVIFDLLAIGLNSTIPIFSGLTIDCLVGVGAVNFKPEFKNEPVRLGAIYAYSK